MYLLFPQLISSPLAVRWALKTLGEIETEGRKIAVLGDMMELGKYTSEEHKKVGEFAFEVCDILITVGVRSKNIAEGALSSGMDIKNISQFEDSISAGKYLRNFIKKDDIILIKGSRWAMRMEKTVEEIMAKPELADKLLVR